MHEKESLAGAFWLVLLIIAGWGGLVRYLIDVKQSKATWSWINALAQIVVSGFTGVIGGLISIESGFSIYMILATAGIPVLDKTFLRLERLLRICFMRKKRQQASCLM